MEFTPHPPKDDCLPWFSVTGPSPSLWLYKPDHKATVADEVSWRLVLATTQSCRGTCGYLMAVGGATRLPPPLSDDSTAAGPPLLICHTSVRLVAADLHIWRSAANYPKRHLGRQLVAGSLAPTLAVQRTL